MPKAVQKEVKLIRTCQRIITCVDNILSCIEPLWSVKYNPDLSQESLKDVKNIYKSALVLKQKIINLLNDNLLHNFDKNTNREEYFGNVRHDLRDVINAIKGYTEIAKEEFRNINSDLVVKELLKIDLIILKILVLVDKIKFYKKASIQSHPSFDIPNVNIKSASLENIVSDVEYHHFKEMFSILIADDLEENCNILEHNLKKMGYVNIHIARNGLEALEMQRENHFDLALLDINMPGKSGIELLEILRHEILQRKIMVVIVTGADNMQKAIKCIQYGAEDILLKPFNTELLRVRINACFEKKLLFNVQSKYQEDLEIEKQRYKDLLHAIFPPVIVEELITTNHIQTRNYENVSVLFIDVVDFTLYCKTHSLDEITKNIQKFAEICETVSAKFNLQKIKTTGDGFLAIAGMLTKHKNPVLDCIKCVDEIYKQTKNLEAKWKLHAGIDYGHVIGGVVGHCQYLFDIWGATTNIAAHMQALAEPSSLYLSRSARDQVNDSCDFESLGEFPLKGKTKIDVFRFIKFHV